MKSPPVAGLTSPPKRPPEGLVTFPNRLPPPNTGLLFPKEKLVLNIPPLLAVVFPKQNIINEYYKTNTK